MNAIEVTLELLQSMPIPSPAGGMDKDKRGRVLLIAGSALSPGASVLAGEAALRAGAGKLLVGVSKDFAVHLGLARPEFGILALAPTSQGEPNAADFEVLKRQLDNCDVVLLGPGMVDEGNAAALARQLLAASDRTIVLDAAAITGLRNRDDAQLMQSSGHRAVMTPHAGELAVLTGVSRADVEDEPAKSAHAAAKELGSIIILKGPKTYIADPNGELWQHSAGVPGLGTAGSGDVLAGLLAGLIARGTGTAAACLWSVFLHSRAGARLAESVGILGFLARQLPEQFPHLLDETAGIA